MSASNNSTTHPTSSAPAGAMALYEKYSALHSGIEEARQQISQCQQDQDTLRDKIQRAREERVEMQQETERAKKETQDLHSQVQEALQENDATEQERLTLMECTNARRNYQVTKQYIQDQHQSYLESSRDFRQRCKRLRVTASAVGAPMATSHAFLALHAEDLSAEELEYLACPMEQQDEEQLDEELEQALEEHERSKKTRDDARADLQRVRKLDQESRGRAMNRRHKKEQLEAQLERLRNDVTDLRLELSTIENETQEAKEYAQNFERDAAQRRRASRKASSTTSRLSSSTTPSVTPSPYVRSRSVSAAGGGCATRNPYAKSSGRSSSAAGSSSVSTSTSATGPAPIARANTTSSTSRRNDRESLDRRQHPHRIGRLRSSREFSTALDIIGGEENDDGEEYEAKFETMGAATTTAGTNATSSSSSSGYVFKTIGKSRSTLADSDDEDEDELFSYVAFSDKK